MRRNAFAAGSTTKPDFGSMPSASSRRRRSCSIRMGRRHHHQHGRALAGQRGEPGGEARLRAGAHPCGTKARLLPPPPGQSHERRPPLAGRPALRRRRAAGGRRPERDRLSLGALMDIVIRAAVMFIFVWFVTRAVGRRELSTLEPFDLILLVVLGDLIQQAVTQNDFSVTGAMLAGG